MVEFLFACNCSCHVVLNYLELVDVVGGGDLGIGNCSSQAWTEQKRWQTVLAVLKSKLERMRLRSRRW
jgi:hypothetical protein